MCEHNQNIEVQARLPLTHNTYPRARRIRPVKGVVKSSTISQLAFLDLSLDM